MKKVIIFGSARKDGETKKLVLKLLDGLDCDLIDLSDYSIGHFDYEHRNREDDFLDLMRGIVENYEVLIFATPVYWYAMSGRLKVFFDRLTDLLLIEKSLGRKLRHKSMAALSCSNGDNLGEHFWLPFRKTAEYLGMHYIGNLHAVPRLPDPEKLAEFRRNIEEKGRSDVSVQ